MKRYRICTLTAAALACLQLAGCGSATSPASSTLGAASDAGSNVTDVAAPEAAHAGAEIDNPLAAEWPILYDTSLTPAVESFTIAPDFSNVINADEIDYWSDDAKKMLLENGFVVLNSTGNEFYDAYETNRYVYTPNYVTVDALLHSYHLYYLYLQRGVEEKQLAPLLSDISTALQTESLAQYEVLKGSEWENAALRNLAFFTVGAKLLNPDATVPAEAAEPANEELALIDGAAGIAESPLMNLNAGSDGFTVQEDYTQYIPRSYYTKNETLERYFKAMMWYGRMSFLQANEDLNRSALLMTLALDKSGAAESWKKIYQITSFFAGASDDAGYIDYAPLAVSVYGENADVKALVGDSVKWDSFVKSAAALRPAAINSMPIMQWDDREDTELAFRFMGQRFTFDASIFANLTYRNVEKADDGRQRLLPSGLDVPAALGSDTAVALMEETGSTNYPNYTEQLEKTRTALAEAPESAWQASLYGGWLNTLKPLAETKGAGYPTFMQNDAWTTRNLSSFLGSWTELKHDSALYAKQNYSEMGGAPIDEADDRGYVEAEPVVFGRLAAMSQVTANGLKAMGVLSNADAESLDRMYQLNLQLMQIAEKELRGELPSDEEFELIRTIGGQLEHFWTEVMADEISKNEYFSPMEMPSALVADVATDPNGLVLQTGTDVGTIYVVVSVDGSLRLASGTVFNYFEFEQPMNERMTDKDWWIALGKMAGDDGEVHWEDKKTPADWTDRFAMNSFYE